MTAYDTTDVNRREPRVHVLRKPPDWEMTPPDGRVTAADDQYLLLQIWELVGVR